MRVSIALEVQVDADHVEHLARRRGISPDAMLRELALALECKANDSVRWADGVEGVRSRAHAHCSTHSEALV